MILLKGTTKLSKINNTTILIQKKMMKRHKLI